MARQYHYPCSSCGKKYLIDTSMAAQDSRCPFCSTEQPLPRLSEIRRLEPEDEDYEPGDSSGRERAKPSAAQAWLFITGLPILLIASIAAGGIYLQLRAEKSQLEQVERQLADNLADNMKRIESLEIGQMWELWHESVLANPIGGWVQSDLSYRKQTIDSKWYLIYISLGFASLGLLLIASSFLFRRKNPK